MDLSGIFTNLSEPKNITIAAVASCFSAAIAILALLVTVALKRGDVKRQGIGEFYDVVNEISELRKFRENLAYELGIEEGSIRYRRNQSILNDRIDLLLSRADFILRRGIEPTDVALKVIGGTLLEFGRPVEAAKKHAVAVKHSTSLYKRAINRRSYGRSLILSGELEQGRKQCDEAVREFAKAGDLKEFDRKIMLVRRVETLLSKIDAQVRIDARTYIKDDLIAVANLIEQVDDREAKYKLDKTLDDLRGQIHITFKNFAD